MNITFMIGNGFDLNLGLKTRYTDFYPYFKKNASDDNMIKAWINDSKIELWSDLEYKLGRELCRIGTEEELEKFYTDKDELDELLVEYLEKEQDRYKIDTSEIIRKEMTRSLLEFYKNLSTVNRDSIQNTLSKYITEDYGYNFINFNYTNIIDQFVATYPTQPGIIGNHRGSYTKEIRMVHHIHGQLDADMILGVNDESQIDNDMLKRNPRFLNGFIKQNIDREIGNERIQRAINLIDKSSIICVFGLSMGETDKIYWEKLISWLKVDSEHKLIVYVVIDKEKTKRRTGSKIVRIQEDERFRVFKKGQGGFEDEVYNEIKDRIMISINDTIFSFPIMADCKDDNMEYEDDDIGWTQSFGVI